MKKWIILLLGFMLGGAVAASDGNYLVNPDWQLQGTTELQDWELVRLAFQVEGSTGGAKLTLEGSVNGEAGMMIQHRLPLPVPAAGELSFDIAGSGMFHVALEWQEKQANGEAAFNGCYFPPQALTRDFKTWSAEFNYAPQGTIATSPYLVVTVPAGTVLTLRRPTLTVKGHQPPVTIRLPQAPEHPFLPQRYAEDFFPLMAWSIFEAGHCYYGPEVFKDMAECGLNVAGFVTSREQLDQAADAGLKAYLFDVRARRYDWSKFDPAEARRQFGQLAEETAEHPALLGYYVTDEPDASKFGGLAEMLKIVKEYAPDKEAYVNLLPNYAEAAQLGTADYASYIERFLTECRPEFFGYDFYGMPETRKDVIDGFFSNLATVRTAAQEHNTPFWVILLSSAHFKNRIVDQADLSFQVYSALAYGARGIAYFTYATPRIGNYRQGPLDQFGAKTPTWYAMQYVNRTVQALAPTLNQLRTDAVYHFPATAECPGPDENALITALPNGNFLVGEFTHEKSGRRYVMIVNKDLENSEYLRPVWRVAPTQIRLVSPWQRGELLLFGGEHGFLGPGQGVLLQLD